MEDKFDILTHELVPKHMILSKDDVKKLLKKYNISVNQLPKISIKDPVISKLKANVGDVIKIIRKSETNVESVYYRVVINE